jgi:hypothetical protein
MLKSIIIASKVKNCYRIRFQIHRRTVSIFHSLRVFAYRRFKSYLILHRDIFAHVVSNWHFSRSEIVASNSKENVASERKERLSVFFRSWIIQENDHDYWDDEIFTCVALFSSDHRSRSSDVSTTRILLLEDHSISHLLFAHEYCKRILFAVFKINFFTSWYRRCSRRYASRIDDRDFDVFIRWIDFERACFFVVSFFREACDSRTFNSKNTKISFYFDFSIRIFAKSSRYFEILIVL